jgi:hypothetical protein
MAITSAAMPPVLIYREDQKCVEEILIKGLPLGAMRHFDYQEREIEVSRGDTVLFMSDGFPELVNESGETLGYERVAEIFKQACSTTTPRPLLASKERDTGGGSDVIERLNLAAANWANGNEGNLPSLKNLEVLSLTDDVTFVVVKVI